MSEKPDYRAYPDLELALTQEALSGLAEICILSEVVPGEARGSK